jgi:Spy/CpxP family protein refolding chaperone
MWSNRQPVWLGILLAFVLLIGSAQVGLAGSCGGKGDFHQHWGRMLKKLDLSEDQQAKVKEILAEKKSAGLKLHKEVMRLQHEVRGEMLEDAPDAGEVAKLVRRIGELRSELHLKRLEGEIEVRKILTDEQRDRMLLDHHRGGRHHAGMGCGHDGWCGCDGCGCDGCGRGGGCCGACSAGSGCHGGGHAGCLKAGGGPMPGPRGCAPGCGHHKGGAKAGRCLHAAEPSETH